MTSTGSYAGGLQGWNDGNTLIIENSLFKGSYTGGGSFHPIAVTNATQSMHITDNGAYYTTTPTLSDDSYIAAAGKQVYTSALSGTTTESITLADGITYYKVTDYETVSTIATAQDWTKFVNTVNVGNTYQGKTVTLDADITITDMAGTSVNKFMGTFNGNGHTLNLDLTSAGEFCAPFRYVNKCNY